MTEHTAGPWHIQTCNSGMICVDAPDDKSVCAVGSSARNNEANARLIASAPELLAACLAVSEEARDINKNGDIAIPSHVWDLIAQALNKAQDTALHRFDIATT